MMELYGANIPLDRRKLVGFGRDISLISEAEYQALPAPSSVSAFPTDLSNPALEYSGVYEDGWVSEAAFFYLRHKGAAATLRITGMIPQIVPGAFNSELTVRVDGNLVHKQALGLGDFALDIRIPRLNEN
jgi:hypothetical protein